MFRKIWNGILSGWEWLKRKAKEAWNHPITQQARKDVIGIAKASVKWIPATIVGVYVAYHFPVFLAAIASIPIMRWVVDKWNLPPTARIAVQLGIVFLLDVAFAFFPFVTLVLGILAIYSDIDLVISKIKEAYETIESGVLKAVGDVSPTPTTN